MATENSIENLIYLFSKLPGLGPRSARRIVIHLLAEKNRMNLISNALLDAEQSVEECSNCFNIDSINPCAICSTQGRDNIIAVVENIADLWALERSGSFPGLYHVLSSGAKSYKRNKSEDLRLEKLKQRVQEIGVKELIIATSTTLDGQTIAFYIMEFFKDMNLKITRIAIGVPVGGELDYLDEGTLSAALRSRAPF
ncbi:MAG: recombination protein RecR [Alphaproteobacteria bacterium]|nr:recombination protein RecR [Alphaproteobacteria bacterium]